jgi:hypothetical protein
VRASKEVIFSVSQELRVLTPLHGLLALETDATSQQLLLLQLSFLPLGHAPTLTPIKFSPKNFVPSKVQSAVASRTLTSVMLARIPISTLLLLLVKLATIELELIRDSPHSNPQIPLVLKSKTSTMMMTIFKMKEECFK